MKLKQIPSRYTFKWRVFLICLVLACGMWFLIHLSKTYISPIKIVVNYNQLSSNKILYNKKCDTIDAVVEATGFQIFRYKNTSPEVNINLNDVLLSQGNHYFWLPNRSQSILKENLAIRRIVNIVSSDTIFLNLDERVCKMVRINPKLSFDIPKGYRIKNLKYSTEKAEIFGPKKLLHTINGINTEEKEVKISSSNASYVVSLQLPANVTSPNKSIKLEAQLERITQKIIELPIKVKNLPPNAEIKLVPDRVKIAFTTGFSEYETLTENDFEVICDVKNITNFTSSLPLEFSKYPKNITQLQIKPMTTQVIVISK